MKMQFENLDRAGRSAKSSAKSGATYQGQTGFPDTKGSQSTVVWMDHSLYGAVARSVRRIGAFNTDDIMQW